MTRRAWLAAALSIVSAPWLVQAALGPRYGGELRVGALGSPPSTAPGLAVGPTARLVLGMVHETLLRAGDEGPRPGLADSWSSSADGREWTLALHPRLQFHDGAELTAADAARSIRRFLRSDSPAAAVLAHTLEGGTAFRAGEGDELAAVHVGHSGELRLRFRAPVAASGLLPLAAPAAAVVSERGAACGPFVPTVSNSDELLFVPFGSHVAGRPYLDRVAVRLLPEARRLVAEHRLGRIDVAVAGGAGLTHAPGVLLLVVDPSRAPFQSKELRLALAAAIDRRAMAGRMLRGAEPWHRLLPDAPTPGRDVPPTLDAGRVPRRWASTVTLAVDRTLPTLASQRVVAHLVDLGLTPAVRAVDPADVRRVPAELRLMLFEPELGDPVLAVHEAGSLLEPGAVPPAVFESDPATRLAMSLDMEERLRAHATLIPLARLSRSSEAAAHVRDARADGYTLRVEDAWTALP